MELHIKLTPKSSSNRIIINDPIKPDTQSLNIYVTAVPKDDKANEAMINLLAKHYHLPKSAFTLIRGHKSRNKVVVVSS
jgi:uncharacterized protein YggU (UPF0235/DUF167 family)